MHGWDFANDDNDPSDELTNGHGTHVSGIIGAVANQLGVRGIAPNVKIMPLKFLNQNGDGTSYASLKAIEYAVDKGVKLSNNSYGSVGASENDYMMLDAIEQSGMLFIAAAGNSGQNNDDPRYRVIPASMASDKIISVASANRYGLLSSFSNYGAETVDVAAPGEGILSTFSGGRYVTESGTSMATPMVTGLAAVLMGVRDDWTAEELRTWIMDKGLEFSPLKGRMASGKMVNLYHALDYLLQDSQNVAVTGLHTYPHASIFVGGSGQITYSVQPPSATNKALKWTSSDPQTVTLDTYGHFTGVKPGTATITAQTVDGGFQSSQVITVLEDYGIEIMDKALESLVRNAIGKPNGPLMRSDVYGVQAIKANAYPIYNLQGLEHFESLEELDLRETQVSSLEPIRSLKNIKTLLLRDTQVEDIRPIQNYKNLISLNLSNLILQDGWQDIVTRFTNLEALYVVGLGLEDTTFIESFTHLDTLYIDDNPIQSIDFVANMTSMNILGLKNTQISDISPLQSLTKLENLDLSQNQIVDISPLANKTQLSVLKLNENQIVDLRPLAGLASLSTLDASTNRIQYIRFNGQPLIKELNLSDNRISSIESIQNIANLYALNLRNNRVENIAPLAGLSKLETLDLSRNALRSIEGLRSLSMLYDLDLSSNQISDIRPIADLTLTRLLLYSNQVTDIRPLAGQVYLQVLDLDSNRVSDIRPIRNLVDLEHLYLSRNQITDINVLSDKARLVHLELAENQLTDIRPLAELINLEYLDIDDNQIASIEPLRNKPYLTELYIQNNRLTDISALSGLTSLEEVRFNKNFVRDISALAPLDSLQYLYASQNQVSDISVLLSLDSLVYLEIFDNPLNAEAWNVVQTLLTSGVVVDADDKGELPAPIGLRAIPNNQGGVQISWDSVSGATYYHLYRGSLELEDFALLASVTDNVYQDPSVERDVTYFYAVSASNASGVSPASLPIFITLDGLPPERQAPTNVMAAVYGSTTGTVTLSLDAQDESGISYFEVYRDGALVKKISAETYIDRGLIPGTTYRYKIRAVDPYGNVSDFSSEVEAATAKSNHAALSSLVLSAGTLSPSFSPAVTEYNATVGYSSSSVTVTAAVYEPHATLKVNGLAVRSGEESQPISLQVGANRIEIQVTSQDGTTVKDYLVNLVRRADSSDHGSGSTSSGGSMNTAPPPSAPTGTDSGVRLDPAKDGSVTIEKTADNRDMVKVTMDKDKLAQALLSVRNNERAVRDVTIEVKGNTDAARVELPAAAFLDMALNGINATVTIKTEHAAYQLPAGLLQTLSSASKDGNISITISKVTGAEQQRLTTAAGEAGVTLLLPNALDFTIHAGGQEVTDFGGIYVERRAAVPQSVDANKATAVWMDPAGGQLHFVPSLLKVQSGTTEVFIKSPHNSVYTVISSNVSFDDVKGHWAQSDIELLANKRVVAGQSAGSYAPEQKVTRAQFAALLVRSLGLTEPKVNAKFTDIPAGAWFAGAVAAAVQAGLIEGFEDGSFRPDAPITREQMAVMVSRAMKAAGKPAAAGPATESMLAKFQDNQAISSWARAAVAESMEAGIISGVADTAFQPGELASRAQSAVMLKRMLQYVGFIN